MLWDQLRPGQKFELIQNLTQSCSKNPHPRLVCHLLKPVRDARQVMTTLPVRDDFQSKPSRPNYPAGTHLQVRFMDPVRGCWRFHAGIAAYDQYEGIDTLILSARTTLLPCERRAYGRQTCTIPVRLEASDITGPVYATMLNYSTGGVLIVTDNPLPPGRRIVLVLSTRFGCTRSISCRVVRLEQSIIGFGHRYHIALQFDDPRPGMPVL